MNIDAIICTYNESISKINSTLISCIEQSTPFRKIYLVDDASTTIIRDSELINHPSINLIVLERNKGISGARNTALKISDADYIACINIEVILEKNWLESCLGFLVNKSDAGCVFAKLLPYKNTLLSQWRMRFHEVQFGTLTSGHTYVFAPGHAVLFKKSALDEVGFYNESFKLTYEDGDICWRLRNIGYETYYINNVFCISLQDDNIQNLAKKQLLRLPGQLPGQTTSEMNYTKFFYEHSIDSLFRISRNIYKLRLNYIFIDIPIYILGFYHFYKLKKNNLFILFFNKILFKIIIKIITSVLIVSKLLGTVHNCFMAIEASNSYLK